MILSALKRQEAGETQLQDAHATLERHEKTVPAEIAGVFRKQRALFRDITSGQNSEQLSALETELRRTSTQTLRSIGRMHDESMDEADRVGDPQGCGEVGQRREQLPGTSGRGAGRGGRRKDLDSGDDRPQQTHVAPLPRVTPPDPARRPLFISRDGV